MKEWDHDWLYADLNKYMKLTDEGMSYEEANSLMKADKDILENHAYPNVIDKLDLDAAINALVLRCVEVNKLRPMEKQDPSTLFGRPIEVVWKEIIEHEARLNSWYCVKSQWLNLIEEEKKLLKERNNITPEQ